MSVYSNFTDFSQPGSYNITVPESANRIKVYLVGGGSGGGGGGGGQHNNRKAADAGGGGGGSGSSGEIGFFTNSQSIKNKNISITVGSGGVGGALGNKTSTGKKDDKKNKDGFPGKNGSVGNDTTVTIGSEKFVAKGGIGGNPGNGGLYKSNVGFGGAGGKPNTYGTVGNPGNNGNLSNKIATGGTGGNGVSPLNAPMNKTTFTSASNTGIYPSSNPGYSGAGGEGGGTNTEAKNGGNGNNGYARIYFLDN